MQKSPKLGRPFGSLFPAAFPRIRVTSRLAEQMRGIAGQYFNGKLSMARRDAYKFYVMWRALPKEKQKKVIAILFLD